jgi:hypothetical protein
LLRLPSSGNQDHARDLSSAGLVLQSPPVTSSDPRYVRGRSANLTL